MIAAHVGVQAGGRRKSAWPLGSTATIAADSKHNAFPWACLTADGKVLVAYREGTDHIVNGGGKATVQRSSDGGATWGAKSYAFTPAAGHDYREMASVLLGSGRILMFVFDWLQSPQTGTTYLCHSDDNGVTWSSLVSMGAIFGGAQDGPVMQPLLHSSGVLVAPAFGQRTGQSLLTNGVIRSTDNGATWSSLIVIGATESNNNEATLIELPGGTIQAYIRKEGGSSGNNILLATSTDVGQTWSTPAALSFSCYAGRPAAIYVPDTDQVVLFYRKTTTETSVYRVSDDHGASWRSEQTLDVEGAYVYATPVRTAARTLAVPYAVEIGGNEGHADLRCAALAT